MTPAAKARSTTDSTLAAGDASVALADASSGKVALPPRSLSLAVVTDGETNGSLAAPETRGLRAGKSARAEHRVLHEPGFVLHSYPYRETSLIVDVFTRGHGRMPLVAKGAKRPHSALRGVLQHFQPLALSWSGKGEVRTLTRAEWVGGMAPVAGDALLCGFYVNELVLRFCAREDAHERLFDHYVATLSRLADGEAPIGVLRAFERVLLRESGHAMALDRLGLSGGPVRPETRYLFDPQQGARPAQADDPAHWPAIDGQTLLDMERDDYRRPRTVTQSRALMRFLLDYYLDGAPLLTRQILIDLQNL
ncbi:MAG: DNA repair protein RecO [Janthinobacterium lividum]